MTRVVAALFVEARGVYADLAGVEVWDRERDARTYQGPHRVIAHPPCERWGRYWSGGPMLARTPRRKRLGDDGGCFGSALASVRRWGGVLEHPEASHAWAAFGLISPRLGCGWEPAGDWQGWTCRVEQGHFGHRARKATWLYACGLSSLPILPWHTSGKRCRLDEGFHSIEERRRATQRGAVQRMGKRERLATPPAFRDVLLAMVRGETEPLWLGGQNER